MSSLFHRVTAALARFIGRPLMLFLCCMLALLGILAFASRSQLLIDGTNLMISVLTLMFLPILQATQNRDGAALQAKLDELLKANKEARSELIRLETREEEEIEELRPTPENVTDPTPMDSRV